MSDKTHPSHEFSTIQDARPDMNTEDKEGLVGEDDFLLMFARYYSDRRHRVRLETDLE